MTPRRAERYLNKAEIEEAKTLYMEGEISVRSLAVYFQVNHKSMRKLFERLGLPKRTPGWRPASVMERVNAAKAKALEPKPPRWTYTGKVQVAIADSPLERAKNILRRKGYVVYEPYRFDTSAVKGIVHVDHLRLTAAEVIERAGA